MSHPTSYLNARVGYEAWANFTSRVIRSEAWRSREGAKPILERDPSPVPDEHLALPLAWDDLPESAQQAWEIAASAIARTAEARSKEERAAPYGRCSYCQRPLVEIGVLEGASGVPVVPAFACPDRADVEHQAQIPRPAGSIRLTAGSIRLTAPDRAEPAQPSVTAIGTGERVMCLECSRRYAIEPRSVPTTGNAHCWLCGHLFPIEGGLGHVSVEQLAEFRARHTPTEYSRHMVAIDQCEAEGQRLYGRPIG